MLRDPRDDFRTGNQRLRRALGEKDPAAIMAVVGEGRHPDPKLLTSALAAFSDRLVTPEIAAWVVRYCDDPDEEVRAHVARVLVKCHPTCRAVIAMPVSRMLVDESLIVRYYAARAAANIPGLVAVADLEASLGGLGRRGRTRIVDAFTLDDPAAVLAIQRIADTDSHPLVRWRARWRLTQRG